MEIWGRGRETEKERKCVCRGAAPCWELFVCGVTSLLLEAGVSVADCNEKLYNVRQREKALVSHFWETNKWRSMFSSTAQKAKMCAQAIRKWLRWRICLLGEERGKGHIHLHRMAVPTRKWQSTSILCSQVWLIMKGQAWKLWTNITARPIAFSLSLWVVHTYLMLF